MKFPQGSAKLFFEKYFMKLSILENKLHRYIHGTANTAEVKQVDAWLSSNQTLHNIIDEKKKEKLRQRILFEVQYYTEYPLSFPKKQEAFKRLIPILLKSVLIILLLALYLYFEVRKS
jgi:Cu/Ag efflux pump CusA